VTPVEGLLVFIGLTAAGIWMVLDPSVSSTWRGPQTLVACRTVGAIGVMLGIWGMRQMVRMILRDRRKRKNSGLSA
jgi:hypothetical protein